MQQVLKTAHLSNSQGCDSAATLTLTVKTNTTSTTNTSICSSALPYTWNALTFNAAGSQTAHLTNSQGCDSAATLTLTIASTSSSITNVIVCSIELPFVWNSTSYNASGSYTIHLTNNAGCDSTLVFKFKCKSNTTNTNYSYKWTYNSLCWKYCKT